MQAFLDAIKNNFPAVISGLVASGILSLFLTKYFDRIQERRELFAKSYKAILAWKEMLYRVRRRDNTKEHNRILMDKFHFLQEEIDFYQGMISLESAELGRSYSRFILSVKEETRDLIKEAWNKPNPKLATKWSSDSTQIIDAAADAFLSDVRDWLSIWQFPKFIMQRRNKK